MTPHADGRVTQAARTLRSPLRGRVVHLAIASPAAQRFVASEPLFGVRWLREMYRTEAIA